MLRDEESYIALFIDWDNLAISTAADFGGASPDVRAIVRVAQRYGTILLARAYAEWQVPSDRLAVYRAGVDPIYAPTFRFEPDPVGGPARGKSLADPCLVADCIDMLHLMPTVTHFVLVSGDKDLIPIVRLVQLRGRKVVVIGPDYVAAILRDMADEYVAYRSLVESGETHATAEQIQAGAGGPRRRGGRPVSTARAVLSPSVAASVSAAASPSAALSAPSQPAPIPPAPVTSPPPAPAPSRREQFRDRGAGSVQPRQPAPETFRYREAEREAEIEESLAELADVALPEPLAEETVEIEAPAAAAAAATAEEVGALWSTIGQILHERVAQGKPRLRATNLKDLLMARVSGFDERRYGFNKFRDLLTAAEKAGTIEVNRSGPVHWVTLPRHHDGTAVETESAPAPEPPRPVEPVVEPTPAPAPILSAAPAAPAAAEPVAAVPSAEGDSELVRFVVDLRNRSRWLTYTYVLTNMIAHLSQRIQPQQADAEARNALNRLVQQGVLRVDREPREIEVAGARHRVRMCHLEESHPLVQAVLAEEPSAEPPGAPVVEERPAPEPAPVRQPEREARPPERERQPERETRQPEREARQPEREHREGREQRERHGTRPARQQTPPRVTLPFLQAIAGQQPEESVPSHEPPAVASEAPEEQPRAEAAPAVPAASATLAAWLSPLPDSLLQPSASAGLAPVNPTGASVAAIAAEPEATPVGAAAVPDAPQEKTPLVQAFEALREVIQGATGLDKPCGGAASVTTRLARRLGTFDERSLGFGKFKDFLLAAQRGGYVRVESSGPATRVSLPNGQ